MAKVTVHAVIVVPSIPGRPDVSIPADHPRAGAPPKGTRQVWLPGRGRWTVGRWVYGGRVRGVPWWGVLSAAGAPVLLVGGWTVAAALQPGSFSQVTSTISALAAYDFTARSADYVGYNRQPHSPIDPVDLGGSIFVKISYLLSF